MKKLLKIIVAIAFLVMPLMLFQFVGFMGNQMRWQWGSPLVPGYNWMRWSHIYLSLGPLFCFTLYIPMIIAAVKRKFKLLLIPFGLTVIFILFSIGFAFLSRNVFYGQQMQKMDAAIQSNPQDSEALESKANAYSDMGQYDKAIELYTQALKITKKPAYVFHDRGMAYSQNKQYAEALQDLNKSMEMNPQEKDFIAQGYNDRGITYFHMGEYQKSWEDVQMALKMGYKVHPGFLAALKSKGFGNDQ